MSLPPDEAAARQELMDIVKAETERLEAKLKEHEESAELEGRYSAHLSAFDFSPEGDRMRRYETTCNRYVDRYFKELSKRNDDNGPNDHRRSSFDYMRSRAQRFGQSIRDHGSPKNDEVIHLIESTRKRERDRTREMDDAKGSSIAVSERRPATRIEPTIENEPKTSGTPDSSQGEAKPQVTPKADGTAEPRSERILRNEPKLEVARPQLGQKASKFWDSSRRARRAREAIERQRGTAELAAALKLTGPGARNLLLPVELGV
jgi:hypothetical protein